ncbi:hypothetical protein AB0945_09755 [Streptomyces sp. NPDC005474]|uniref:hypothetical protein n=1 Tax=Streptomyces sp. NPDC005474 TaxID=3154878 RepID=UPI0034511DE2
MRKIAAAASAALVGIGLLAAAPSASAETSSQAGCTAVFSPTKTAKAVAAVQYLKTSSTKITPTSYAIRTSSQGLSRSRTDFTLYVRILSEHDGTPNHDYVAKKGTHYYTDLWGPTFSTASTLKKGKNRVVIDGWYDLNSSAYSKQCGKGVSFAF